MPAPQICIRGMQICGHLISRREKTMKPLIQPKRLASGEKIATVSPCHGWAGDVETKWKYDLGVSRLQELGLQVVAAPNSLRGSEFLSQNPAARADDLQWAFENNEIRAIVANVGGNDSMHPIADPSGWHAYSKKWFLKTLFDASPIGAQSIPRPIGPLSPPIRFIGKRRGPIPQTAVTKSFRARALQPGG